MTHISDGGTEKRVACLYRVSTKKQADGDDIPMQRNACLAFIDTQPGWTMVKEYTEAGVSGYHKPAAHRDALQRLKADAANAVFDVLLVFMFDRLGRREDETPFIVEWLAAHGIDVWSVQEGCQRFDSRVDKLLNFIRYWQSGGESEKTALRVREKHRQMVASGQFRGGSPPYGYRLTASGQRNRHGTPLSIMAIDERESPVVAQIFALAAEQGYGGLRIARHLNERNLYTRRGGRWSAGAVMDLLKNPIYKGIYVSGRRQSGRGVKTRMPPETWVTCEMPTLAIVTTCLWDKAAAVRAARRTDALEVPYPRQTKGPLLLTGLARCGGCGMTMASRYAQKKWTRKSDGETVSYYRPQYYCRRDDRCAGRRSYSGSVADGIVLSIINHWLAQWPPVDLAPTLHERRARQYKADAHALQGLRAHITRHENDIATLREEMLRCLRGQSAFTGEQLAALLAQKEADAAALQTEADILAARLAAACPSEIPPLFILWRDVFDDVPGSLRKMIVHKLVSRVMLSQGQITVYFLFGR